jgi:hypothetical protein
VQPPLRGEPHVACLVHQTLIHDIARHPVVHAEVPETRGGLPRTPGRKAKRETKNGQKYP